MRKNKRDVLGKNIRWVAVSAAMAVALAVVSSAPPALADGLVVTIRYKQVDEVGVAVGHGGGFATLRPWARLSIPHWAKSATVRIVDDRSMPVGGRADVYAGDAPAWADRPQSAGHSICSRVRRTFLVAPGGTLHIRLVGGAVTSPNDFHPVGVDGSRSGPCAFAPSAPTRGTVTVTFRS